MPEPLFVRCCMRTVCLLVLLSSSLTVAQPARTAVDSVIVTGRVRNLSAQLYRESPTVLVSRNNILQASRELVRPAPLNVDGTFRVSLPLIYPQEELYFTYGRISTAFLAAPGTLSIELNADSLFTADVPFRFGGVNAQVNQQFARFKAFEASFSGKPNPAKLSEQVSGKQDEAVYRQVATAFQAPFRAFSTKEKPFPLLTRWVGWSNRYNAASFLYDKAGYEEATLAKSLNDSLRPPDDQLLTAARATAMNRFGTYATSLSTGRTTNGLPVDALASLLLRYGRNLTQTERTRLQSYQTSNSAKASDLRFFQDLVKRSSDTIQRLATYETMIRRSKSQFDSASVSYLTAYWLAYSLPTLTLDFAKLLYAYARPQITDPQLGQSLDELYALEVKDSVRIRAAVQAFRKAGDKLDGTELSPGVFVTKNDLPAGGALFDRIVGTNRGKVVYVLMTTATEEAGQQAALDAQRLRARYRSRDLALVYVPVPGTDPSLWIEFSTKYNLAGDHLLLTGEQLPELMERLRPDDSLSATVINRVGKIVKRNAPLPGAYEEVGKVIDKQL